MPYCRFGWDGRVAWLRQFPMTCVRVHSFIIARRSRENLRSSRPSRSATSATWRLPIRRGLRRPARRSWRTRRRRPNSLPAPTSLRWSQTARRGSGLAISARSPASRRARGGGAKGRAVPGLGNVGRVDGKPVMEGKAVLFKKFAGIDVFDIEIDAHEVDHVVSVVSALEPTFGGINLEDFKG